MLTALEKTKKIVRILDDKKADDIQVIKVEDLTIVSDYFVIASANNATHVKALVDEVEFQMKEQGIVAQRTEGYQYANWIIIDYADVMVHVFYAETRDYYTLDRLWSDGENIDVAKLLTD